MKNFIKFLAEIFAIRRYCVVCTLVDSHGTYVGQISHIFFAGTPDEAERKFIRKVFHNLDTDITPYIDVERI